MKKLLTLIFLLYASTLHAASYSLTWTDNSSNEEGFKVERRLGDTGAWAEVGQVPANATTFSDVTVDNQRYCYQVKAFNQAGDSGYTNIACGVPLPDGNPSGLSVVISITVTVP